MKDADRLNVECFECAWTGTALPGELVRCPKCGEFADEVVETVVGGPFLFPVLRLWRRPAALLGAILWNTCERLRIPQPWAPWLFGVIAGSKGQKRP